MRVRFAFTAAGRALGALIFLACNGPSTTTSSSGESSSVGTSTADPGTDATTATSSGTDTPTTGLTTTGDASSTTGGVTVAKRVFITAATFHGDLKTQGAGSDGVDGADRLCASAAAAAGLGGTWVAWVSSSEVDALTRLADDGRWNLLDGNTEVFASRGTIQFGPQHAIDLADTGVTLLAGETVWTNTDSFGKNSTDGQNDACDDWSAQTGLAAVGVLFDADFGGPGLSWTDTKQPLACGGEHHLYCFEQE
jgi:hypothetical protein